MSYTAEVTIRDNVSGARSKTTSPTITPVSGDLAAGRETVKSSEVPLNLTGLVANPGGYVTFVNRGTTETIRVGLATGVYLISLGPGWPATFPLDSSQAASFFAIASGDTDEANLEYSVRSI